jgi:hypothetical protein
MKTKIVSIMVLAMFVAMLSLSPFVTSFAASGLSARVTGRYFDVSNVTAEWACGNNECVNVSIAETLTGGVAGTALCAGSGVAYPNGVQTFDYACTFVGNLKGTGSGTATLVEIGASVPQSNGNFIVSGHDTWSSGTGAFSGVSGKGTFHGSASAPNYGGGTDTTVFTWQ